MAEDFENMARSYYSDAVHFKETGDYVNAFASVNYAHGRLDRDAGRETGGAVSGHSLSFSGTCQGCLNGQKTAV